MEKKLKSAAAWFEIPCADLDRAQRFYETILGCRMKKDDFGDAGDVMCVFPAEQGGVSGALVKRPFQQPGSSGNTGWKGELHNAAGKPLSGAALELKTAGYTATAKIYLPI